ncbi:alkanesulfonate monooxygenase SsuD/methylene tetrahydromethanopterin reductase-like flavin-dependent oxidoreductase (luciferase family) [Antricoccus suffuscus]|uniref:Alkanesulfonate monooxygenase SsuD/methylene tetrahydromethanopterin reductase-like flavin-dependent oxidoreductase (Luciferase family) n=2 Tax=Antricoccus suffuscus TaxID=1629062 RepID=A0A2T1A361_9ACTN|nr:alkanesulfonate monooxygenase SsuD/methylene tetrahydromethanopterin reductase-like flavin-dependent oxidoreductase (luciferase family) [Antricoccus suffuscus]
MTNMPAISLIAVPGRRQATVDAAVEADQRGFSAIYCPSSGDALGICSSIAHLTKSIKFATSIQPIYFQVAAQLANQASYLNEISGGRFSLGIGVSHAPALDRVGASRGRPLSDIRQYVADLHASDPAPGVAGAGLPPVLLATLRDKMVDLSVEIAEGAIWANCSLNDIPRSIARIPQQKRDAGFVVANMIPTIIDEDKEAAAAKHRKSLTGYVMLPNYRNYWKSAGYEEEMTAIEAAIADDDLKRLPELMSDRWLSNSTLYGSAAEVRDGVTAWQEAGVTTPILVPSALKGGHLAGVQAVFDAFSS